MLDEMNWALNSHGGLYCGKSAISEANFNDRAGSVWPKCLFFSVEFYVMPLKYQAGVLFQSATLKCWPIRFSPHPRLCPCFLSTSVILLTLSKLFPFPTPRYFLMLTVIVSTQTHCLLKETVQHCCITRLTNRY